MPDLDPEIEEAIRTLAEMPDDFYQMYEASGNILMIKAVQFARAWVSRPSNQDNKIPEECAVGSP